MEIENPNNGVRPVSQEKIVVFGAVCRPWSEAETARLEDVAGSVVTSAMIASLFPDRTERSVKCKLGTVRAQMGLSHNQGSGLRDPALHRITMLDKDDPGLTDSEFQRRKKAAQRGSHALLERLVACYG